MVNNYLSLALGGIQCPSYRNKLFAQENFGSLTIIIFLLALSSQAKIFEVRLINLLNRVKPIKAMGKNFYPSENKIDKIEVTSNEYELFQFISKKWRKEFLASESK